MNGLLDFISTPAGQGLLAAVAGGMAGANRGTPWNNAGRAGLAGLMGYSNAQNQAMKQEENAFQKQYRQMQMDEMERKLEEQKKTAEFYANTVPSLMSPKPEFSALANGAGPTLENAQRIPQMPPAGQIDPAALYRAMVTSGIPSLASAGLQGMTKQEEPIKLGKGDRLLAKGAQGYKTLVEPMPDPEKQPEFIRLMNEYQAMPPGPMKDMLGRKLQTASSHAPAPSAQVIMDKPDNKYMETRLSGQAESIKKLGESARASFNQIGALDRFVANADKGFAGGAAPILAGVANFLSSFGYSSEGLKGTQEMQQAVGDILGNKMAELGARGLTDKDMEILREALPRVNSDKAARVTIARILAKTHLNTINEYNSALEAEAQAYPDMAARLPVAPWVQDYRKNRNSYEKRFSDAPPKGAVRRIR